MLVMNREASRGRFRRWLPRIGATAVGCILVGVAAGWMCYRYIPTWYQPAYVPIEDEQAARDELGAAFTALSRGMGRGETFEFIVRQDELNRWLVARHRIWPASKRWIPEQIEGPMIVFGEGEVILAGTWSGPGPRSVISIRVQVEADAGQLRTRVTSVRGGALPFPLGPIKRELSRLEVDRDGHPRPLLPDDTSILDAVEGAPLPRDISWSQPRGKFRVESLTITLGELRARLRPIKCKSRRSPRVAR